MFATRAPQEELVNMSRQLVQIGLEIEELSPTSPKTLRRVHELNFQINQIRQRVLTLKGSQTPASPKNLAQCPSNDSSSPAHLRLTPRPSLRWPDMRADAARSRARFAANRKFTREDVP